jgi:hypothetical protein
MGNEFRMLAISDDLQVIIEIPSDGKEPINWEWIRKAGSLASIFNQLESAGWRVMIRQRNPTRVGVMRA